MKTVINVLKVEVKQIEGLMADLMTKFNAGLLSEERFNEYMASFTAERNELVAQIMAEQEARMAQNAPVALTSTEEEQKTNTVDRMEGEATPAQIKKYMELCLEKKYAPRNTQGWTSKIASSEIQVLLAHRPMSAKQLEMIKSLQAEASEAELLGRTLSDMELTRVSGKQASDAIGRLIQLMKDNSDKLRPTKDQIARIAGFYPCPDVAFEDFGIEIMKQVTDNEGNVVSKRRITRTELETQIKEKLTQYEASKFISDFEPKATAWKATLITNDQIKQIRRLEKRIYNLSSPRQVEDVTDIWGDIIDTQAQGSSRDTKWTVQMEDVQVREEDLKLLTRKEANAFIRQLNIELNAKQDMLKSEDDQLTSDTARNEFGSLADNDEFNEFNNLLFALQAQAGYDVQEFQDEVTRIFFNDLGEGTRGAKIKLYKEIIEFIELQLESKAITALNLVNMTEKSEFGREVVKTIARKNDAVFNALVFG